jgi:hypothetical protein
MRPLDLVISQDFYLADCVMPGDQDGKEEYLAANQTHFPMYSLHFFSSE